LLEKNAKVYLAARSKEKAEAAIAELKTKTGKEAIFLELDLSDLTSVRKAAATFLRYIICVPAGSRSPPYKRVQPGD
jgi:retinol dehydrogenase 12